MPTLNVGISRKQATPSKEVMEKSAAPVPMTGVGVAAEQNMRLSSSSSEFYKLYSPMADRMAEAARQSTNGACWTSVVCICSPGDQYLWESDWSLRQLLK